MLRNFRNKIYYESIKLLRLLNGYSFLFPKDYLVMLTYRCNLSCPYCVTRFPDLDMNKLEFDLPKFKIIEKNAASFLSFRSTRYTFMGGEPTLAKDFLPIIKYLSEKRYKISIRTNGFFSENIIRGLAEARGVDRVFISLHTNDYQKILENIKLFKKYQRQKKINIYINCTINHVFTNNISLSQIAEIFENSGARHIRFQHSMSIFSLHEKYELVLLKKQLLELNQRKFKTNVFVYPNIKIKDIDKYYLDKDYPHKAIRCFAPWKFPVLIPNGTVVPCFCSDKMGNLYSDRIRDIWNGKAYVSFRRKILKKMMHSSDCYRCVFREY